MTLFTKMMDERLSRNAKAIDTLKAQERILFQIQKVIADWKVLGGRITTESGGINLLGNKAEGVSGPTLKDAKIIMDEYIYSDARFTVYSHQGGTWIFNKITDTTTQGSFSVDFGMAYMKGCIKTTKEVTREAFVDTEVTYKCPEEVTNGP